jgi:hypothetical protein
MKRLDGRVGLSGVLVAIGAAAAVFGTAKTLAESLTGHALSLADLAYYTGSAALVAYYGVAAFAVTCIALLVGADRLRGHWDPPAWADLAAVLAPVVAAFAATAYALLTFTWDPGDAGAGWALFVRFVGIAAVAAAVLAYRRSADEAAAQTGAAP